MFYAVRKLKYKRKKKFFKGLPNIRQKIKTKGETWAEKPKLCYNYELFIFPFSQFWLPDTRRQR
jgi:hypothetical protein